MFEGCFAWGRLIVSVWLFFSITACATTRYIAAPSDPRQDLGLQGATGDVEVNLHHIIVPDGPGSWVKGARWIEWVINIRTLTPSNVRIEKISLVDFRGVVVGAQYASLDQVASESAKLADAYKGLASDAIGQVVNSFIPLKVLIAATVSSFAGSYREAKDRDAIGWSSRSACYPPRSS